MSKCREGLSPEYYGFLHRHEAKPGFPEMKKHVVVDLEDWKEARELKAQIKEMAQLIKKEGSRNVFVDYSKLREMLIEMSK